MVAILMRRKMAELIMVSVVKEICDLFHGIVIQD